MLLNLDLQRFADDVDDISSEGELELASAIRDLAREDFKSPDVEDEEIEEVEEDSDDESEDSDIEEEDLDEAEDDVEDEEVEEPKRQSKEDNAKFAARRRQQELEQKVQEELKNSAEYKLAQKLAKQFGKPIDQILTELEEADIQQEAEQRKTSPEQIRREREATTKAEQLEQEINKLKFQNWQTQIKADGQAIMSEYTMLKQEDIDTAVDYILNVAKNVELPLEDAVFAVHGKKIAKAMATQKVQDDLANQSGRKRKTPLSPNNSKPSTVKSLSADEAYIAKQFGMSEDEYRKYMG